MKNQYIKTSDIGTNERRDYRDAPTEGDKPLLLSETVKAEILEHKVFRRSIFIILESKFEYDRIKDLLDSVMYHKKLMNCYGLDMVHNKWDLTKFPVTKTDGQMEGIQCDIQKYNETVHQYHEYSKHLGLEYGIDILGEMKKGCNVIFRPPSIDYNG